MANLSTLNIGIGTNLGRLDSGLSQASKKISSFSKGVEKRLGGLSMGKLDQGLRNISQNVPSAGKALKGMSADFQQGRSQIRASSAAVVNFNRVIQDAPFGIIGVANNLEPLASSFATLKGQIGSTSGAIGHLLKSAFTGPGALITAVSLASSAMLFFSMRMRGTKKEAEELNESMSTLNKSWERTVELQEQFGAFDDDEFGMDKLHAEIKEVNEDIEQQEANLRRINELRKEAARIEAQKTTQRGGRILTGQQRERLKLIDREIKNLGDSEQIQLRINKLSEKRQRISEQMINTADALADSDTQQARESQKTTEAKQRQLEFEKKIAEARESLRMGEAPELEFLTDLPEIPDEDMNVPDKYFPPGSLGALKNRLKGLQSELMIATNPQHIERLQKAISETKDEMDDLKGETNESEAAMEIFGNAIGVVAGNFSKGAEEANKFENAIRGLAPKLLAHMFFPGGGFGAEMLRGFFAGVFHQGGTVPGALGQERLALVQGGETIRTPKQERALSKGSGGKRVIQVPVYLNNRQIATATAEYEETVNR